jgi:hypothetical protein
MDTHIQIEQRLWDYIDGLSSPEERSTIQTLLAENIEWQRKYKELLNIHQLMTASELDAPSMRFTKNVMEEIARHQVAPAAKTYINKNIIRTIGAFFLTMIAGFLVYCLGQFKWSTGNSVPLPAKYNVNVNINKINTEIEKFDWSRIFNSAYTNIFMFVLAILGLVLLDMYLQQKKKAKTSQ